MKKLMFLAVIAMVLTVFNACEKSKSDFLQEEQIGKQKQEGMFAGLDSIRFSVDNNRLCFESEKDYQKCLDFLAQLGDKNFPAFEKKIGFESYRAKFQNDPIKSRVIADEMYQTILNPEMEIVIGNYLFKEDPDKQHTIVADYSLERDCSLKSANSISNIQIGWENDAFAVLAGKSEPRLKSGCSSANYNESSNSAANCTVKPDCTPDYAYEIYWDCDLNFQQTALYKSIIAKVKLSQVAFSQFDPNKDLGLSPVVFKLIFNSIGKATYDRAGKNQFCGNVNEEQRVQVNTWTSEDVVSWRPFYGTTQVNCYNITMEMGIEMVSGATHPTWNGQKIVKTHTLKCNETDSHCTCN